MGTGAVRPLKLHSTERGHIVQMGCWGETIKHLDGFQINLSMARTPHLIFPAVSGDPIQSLKQEYSIVKIKFFPPVRRPI